MAMPDRNRFHIVAWIGPSKEQITRKSMAELAEAGFNVSLSQVDSNRVIESLDLAREAGVRLILWIEDLDASDPGEADAAWERRAKVLVAKVRRHPALFGYFVADEPRADRRAFVARAMRVLADEDPDHLPYCNHWSVNMSYAGYRSYEEMWDLYGEEARPQFVSLDGYPFSAVSEEEWTAARARGNPCYFPRHRARIMAHYFEQLDFLRQYGRMWRVPSWYCVLSGGAYSTATNEGELLFQIMTGLAYGVTGIQYFSYAHGGMMIEADTTPTPAWHIAKRANRLLRAWEPTLMKLRSLGVYHYPHDLAYTRPLDQFFLGNRNDLVARGDPVVVGQFADDEGWEYALIVNRTPFEPAMVKFHFGTDGDVHELHRDGTWQKPWPFNPRGMPLQFQPGQGRLFRFKREITLAPPA